MSLKKKIGVSFSLMFVRKIYAALLSIFVMAYLTRVLDKELFGIIAISATLIKFVEMLGLSGLSEYAIIYNEDDKKEVINATFWLNILIAGTIALIVFTLAPFWADYYGDERIKNVVYLTSFTFFFTSASSIHQALLKKQTNFKKLVLVRSVVGTLTQLSQLAMAYLGYGVYSLIVPSLIFNSIQSFIFIYLSDFKVSLRIDVTYFRQIFSYSKFIIGSRLLGFFVNYGDNLFIGKFLSLGALGVYEIAYRLASMYTSNINPMVMDICFPLISKSKNNIKELNYKFKKIINVIGLVNIPVILLSIIFAKEIIHFLYGSKWDEAVLPFQILSLFVLTRSVGSPASSLYNATGNSKTGFMFSLLSTPVFIIVLFFSAPYGLVTLCVSVTLYRIIGDLVHFILTTKLLNNKITIVYKVPFTFFAISIVNLVFNYCLNLSLVPRIIVNIFFFTMVYVVFKKNIFTELIDDVKSIFNSTFKKKAK